MVDETQQLYKEYAPGNGGKVIYGRKGNSHPGAAFGAGRGKRKR